MRAAFMWADLVAGAAYLGDAAAAAVPSLPITNLVDPQPRHRARWQPAVCQVWADLGAEQTVECVAVIGTSLGAASLIQAKVGNDAGFGTAAWDSGSTVCATDAAWNGNVVLLAPEGTAGRYLQVTVVDPSASYLDIGRLVAGPLWRFTRQPAYGMEEGRLILDRRSRNEVTAAQFPARALFNPRVANFALPLLTGAEMRAQHRGMLATLGAAGDALWLPDLDATQQELNARAIWGAIAREGSPALATHRPGSRQDRSFALEERL